MTFSFLSSEEFDEQAHQLYDAGEYERALEVLREGLRRSMVDEGFDVVGEADNGEEAVRLAAELQPDVVVLMTTSWDLLDRRWDGATTLTPLDAEYATRLESDFRAVTDQLLTAGAGSVAWIRPPIPNVWWMNQGTGQEDPARHAVTTAIYADLAADRPGDVGVIPLDTWLLDAGLDDDETIRPDGVHWDPDAARRLAEDYLGERIIRVALA